MKKAFNVLLIVVTVFSLIATSCEGPEGPQGAMGSQGPQGEQGIQGPNGQDGVDGNANVVASDWITLDFPDSWDINDEARFEYVDANITQEVIDSYALLSYVKFTSSDTSASSVPFVSLNSTYEIHDSMLLGSYVAFAIGNDTAAQPTPPANMQVRYVLIAPSNLSGKTDAPSLQSMKELGIDVNDYMAVMDYLGLDY